jgi:hypothetical protein
VHNQSATPETPVNALHLYVKNNTSLLTDDSYIRFKDYATDGFDGLYDAQKFYPSDLLMPQLFTRIAGFEDLAINTFGTLDGYREIPLGFMTTVAGTFTITADLVSSFTSNGNHVYLRDNVTSVIQDLSVENTYVFTSGITNNLDRFLILINSPIVAFPAIALDNDRITTYSGVTTVQFPYNSTVNDPDLYSVDFDAIANAAGLIDVTNASITLSQISVSIPNGLAPGTYNAVLNVKIGSTGAISIDYPITIELLTNFSTTQDMGTTLLLSWTAASGSPSYTLQYRKVGTSTWIGTPASTNQVKLSNLLPSTEYECKVTTYKNGAFYSISQIGTFTTTSIDYTLDQDIGTTAMISWSELTWASKYTLQYRKIGSSVWIGISTTTNNIKISNLTPGSEYECRINVYRNNTLWGISQIGTFTPSIIEFNPSNITSSSLTITWNDFNSWATSYFFQYRIPNGTWYGQTVNSSSVNLSNLALSTTYECRVYVYKNSLWGISQVGSFTTGGNKEISIVQAGLDSEINVYPNPFAGQVNLDVFAGEETYINWNLIDMTGRLVLNGTQMLGIGNNSLSIITEELPRGVYMLYAEINEKVKNFRILKQ